MSEPPPEPPPVLAYPLRLDRAGRLEVVTDGRQALVQLFRMVVDHGPGDLPLPGLADPCDAPGVLRPDGHLDARALAREVRRLLRAAGWPGTRVEVQSSPTASAEGRVGRVRVEGGPLGPAGSLMLDVRSRDGRAGLFVP